MKWDRKFWRRYAAFAGVLATAGGTADVVSHSWPQLGITVGATATTLFFSRKGFKRAAEREAHHPDYAKIARLEIELGLVEAPPSPPPAPPIPASEIRHVLESPPFPVYRPRTFCGSCGHWDDSPHASWCPRAPKAPPGPGLVMPDQRCSLCIPGRPAANCPFNSICQK